MFLKNVNLKVWQTCHDLFKYQVYLYGSEAITYWNAFLLGGNSASTMSKAVNREDKRSRR
jgi:hypothetical protein